MKSVHLVACVAGKRRGITPAADLYTSTWFKAARRFAQFRGEWRILSAEHGVLNPRTAVAPYEKTLNVMPIAERRRWAERVLEQLRAEYPTSTRFVFLAGLRYREELVGPLREMGHEVEVPMSGLAIGQQVSWLHRHRNP